MAEWENSPERACLEKIWAAFVWEAGIHLLIKMSKPTRRRTKTRTWQLDSCNLEMGYDNSTLTAFNIPQWSSYVSRPLGSRPRECLSRIPWWYLCDYKRRAANLLAVDKGRLDIWTPWSSAHRATGGKTEDMNTPEIQQNYFGAP